VWPREADALKNYKGTGLLGLVEIHIAFEDMAVNQSR